MGKMPPLGGNLRARVSLPHLFTMAPILHPLPIPCHLSNSIHNISFYFMQYTYQLLFIILSHIIFLFIIP
jgi:hypothetical protein